MDKRTLLGMYGVAALAAAAQPKVHSTERHAPIRGRVVGWQPVQSGQNKINRNAPCPCGCGRKAKRCNNRSDGQ